MTAEGSGDPHFLGSVAIVGAGQVGTALGMALRASGAAEDVSLFDRSPARAAESLGRGAGGRVLRAPEEALRTDTIILALPVPEIVGWIEAWGARVGSGTLVVDTGSAKRAVVEAMGRFIEPEAHAVGGHPLAGIERSGPANADPDLLHDAPFVLTPSRRDAEGLARARELARAVGSHPVVMDADAHDRLMARTSHLAHLSAAALALVGDAARGNAPVLASPGFREATRLAASDPAMVAGFAAANADEIRAAVDELIDTLRRIGDVVPDPKAAARLLGEAGSARERALG